MKKLLLILCVFALSGCAAKPEEEYQRFTARTSEVGFDTVITFIAYTKSESEFNQYFEIVKEEYIKYNQLFDRYNDYEGINNIKTLNDNSGKGPVKVDPIIINMLELAKEYTEITNGYFDISLGAVLDIWHDYREEGIALNDEGKPGEVPPMEILEEASKYTGMDYVVIDHTNNTVEINHEKVKLDVGAIAKGYATELIAQKLESQGLLYGIVSGGGNIRTINSKPNDEPWAIGIEKPSYVVKNESLDIFTLPESMSLVTSGDYQRYYIGPDDIRYSHLINKDTLMPANTFQSLSVVTKDSGMADALSTALYMMDYETGLSFIESFNETYPERKVDVVWIIEGDEPQDWYHKDGFSFTMTQSLESASKFLTDNQ